MSDEKSKKKRRKRALKILYRILLALGLALALCAALMLSLPALLSSDFVRARAVQELAKATGKPARLDALSFSWGDGLRLRGLAIGRVGADGQGRLDDPDFLASLKTLHADIGILAALRGDIRLAVELDGLRLHLPPRPEPPEKPLADALRELFATLNAGLKPAPLKLDAHGKLELADMAVRLEPKPGGKAVELRGMSLRLDAPGLRSAPLSIAAALDVYADQRLAAPVRLEASVSGLLDASGRMVPAQAALTAKAQAPGVDLAASGSLAKTLKIDLRARLREALAPARALSPKPLPPALADLDGNVALGLTLALPGADKLNAGLLVFADALRTTAGQAGGKGLGPLSFSLLQEAELDLAAQTVRLPGSFEMKPGSEAKWTAQITGLDGRTPRVTLSVKPLRLDLASLATLGGALPPGLRLGTASLEAAGIDVAADIPAPGQTPGIEARVSGLDISARDIARRDASGEVRLAGANLRLDSAVANLPAAAPGSAEAGLSLRLESLRQTPSKPGSKPDAKPMLVRALTLPRLSLRADGLAHSAAALFGMVGKAEAELEAKAEGVEVAGAAQAPDIAAHMRLRAELPAAKSADLNLESFELSAPVVRVPAPGKKAVEAPLTLRANAPEIRLSQSPSGLVPSVRGLRADLDLGAALRANVEASLGGSAGRDLNTSGRASIDTGRLLALAAAFAPRQAKASGAASVEWKLAAALPAAAPAASTTVSTASAKTAAAPTPKKLSQTVKELAFISEAEAVLRLDNLSLDWPLAAKPGAQPEVLRLRGLATPRPLRLSTRGGARESSLAGTLAFGPLDSLPGAGRLDRPLRGLVTVNAAQQGARSVQLSEVLHLDGFELDQNLTLTLDKLDQVLDRDDRLTAALELLDARATFSLSAGNLASALPAKAGKGGQAVSGKGRLEAGAEVRLSGGRSLAVSARLLSPGLDLALGPDASITGLTSNVRFARRYSLAKGLACPGDDDAQAAPLSEQVFDLFPAAQAAPPQDEALGRLLRAGNAAAPGAPGGVFGLKRLKLKSGGLPLDVHDIELRLDDSGPVPGLRSFRAGLLGGNVLGSAMVRKDAGRYSLDLDMAFTGIDPGRLFPAKTPRDAAAQAETSGRVRLLAPITADAETLLQRLDFRADITKIGPRTLERMLYALDPEEQNETIVQQRRLMGIGYPRYLRVAAAYGNLSVSGAVDVKGFQLDLPPVDRLAIANLPLRKQLAKPLSSVPALLKALDAASGARICRNPSGGADALRVVQSAATQGAPQ
jgi:hypothetical protein